LSDEGSDEGNSDGAPKRKRLSLMDFETRPVAPDADGNITGMRDQPFYVRGRGWIKCEDVNPGDLIRTPTGCGRLLRKTEIKPDEPAARTAPHVVACRVTAVYHHPPAHIIRVYVDHKMIGVTPEHPFYVKGRGWTAARKLNVGDPLLSPDGSPVTVTKVEDLGEIVPVYNIQVEGAHTYFVSPEGGGPSVLVHNDSVGPQLPVPPTTQPVNSWQPFVRDDSFRSGGLPPDALGPPAPGTLPYINLTANPAPPRHRSSEQDEGQDVPGSTYGLALFQYLAGAPGAYNPHSEQITPPKLAVRAWGVSNAAFSLAGGILASPTLVTPWGWIAESSFLDNFIAGTRTAITGEFTRTGVSTVVATDVQAIFGTSPETAKTIGEWANLTVLTGSNIAAGFAKNAAAASAKATETLPLIEQQTAKSATASNLPLIEQQAAERAVASSTLTNFSNKVGQAPGGVLGGFVKADGTVDFVPFAQNGLIGHSAAQAAGAIPADAVGGFSVTVNSAGQIQSFYWNSFLNGEQAELSQALQQQIRWALAPFTAK
jgi:hypothetical protein